MFSKAAPAAEVISAMAEETSEELIPLSHLELDVPTPVAGWANFLAARDIEITLDDIGRMAVARSDARMLIAEKRGAEARAREAAARQERAAVEADQQFRATVGKGVPTSAIPADSTYAQAAFAAELNALDYLPRRQTMVETALSNSKEMVIHPLEREEVEW